VKPIGQKLDERIEAYFFRSLLQQQPITAIVTAATNYCHSKRKL
jgi:hypothetical protein